MCPDACGVSDILSDTSDTSDVIDMSDARDDTSSAPLSMPTCPLCSGANACVPASSGRFDRPCWCEAASFDAALLERVPPALRGIACVCARCAGADAPSPA